MPIIANAAWVAASAQMCGHAAATQRGVARPSAQLLLLGNMCRGATQAPGIERQVHERPWHEAQVSAGTGDVAQSRRSLLSVVPPPIYSLLMKQ